MQNTSGMAKLLSSLLALDSFHYSMRWSKSMDASEASDKKQRHYCHLSLAACTSDSWVSHIQSKAVLVRLGHLKSHLNIGLKCCKW